MSNGARSVFIFAIYMVLLGITLMLVPNVLLTLFALPATDEVWIRVVAMLVLLLAFYYIKAARAELKEFLQWTVYTRGSVILFFITFVALGLVKPALILFGVVDLLGALWTRAALRASSGD
jgi:hypothetical protein